MSVSHSGFVAIVGKPNVGKSTLLNAMLGEKLAIVSPKPQTTRNRITGVLTKGDTQVVFLDTPGMHRARNKLGEYMVKTVDDSISDVDAAILVVEPNAGEEPAEQELTERLAGRKIPVVLAVNKIDTVPNKEDLMRVIAAWNSRCTLAAVVPISAKVKDGVRELLDEIIRLMPEGPHYFPDDTLTDEPEREVAAEIIREKLLNLLSEEVPHGVAVTVEKMHGREQGGVVDVEADIYCERESHKGIIIGKGGAMLKKVGTLSRIDIERMLGEKVNLRLWVKVREGWRNRADMLRDFGYR